MHVVRVYVRVYVCLLCTSLMFLCFFCFVDLLANQKRAFHHLGWHQIIGPVPKFSDWVLPSVCRVWFLNEKLVKWSLGVFHGFREPKYTKKCK